MIESTSQTQIASSLGPGLIEEIWTEHNKMSVLKTMHCWQGLWTASHISHWWRAYGLPRLLGLQSFHPFRGGFSYDICGRFADGYDSSLGLLQSAHKLSWSSLFFSKALWRWRYWILSRTSALLGTVYGEELESGTTTIPYISGGCWYWISLHRFPNLKL